MMKSSRKYLLIITALLVLFHSHISYAEQGEIVFAKGEYYIIEIDYLSPPSMYYVINWVRGPRPCKGDQIEGNTSWGRQDFYNITDSISFVGSIEYYSNSEYFSIDWVKEKLASRKK